MTASGVPIMLEGTPLRPVMTENPRPVVRERNLTDFVSRYLKFPEGLTSWQKTVEEQTCKHMVRTSGRGGSFCFCQGSSSEEGKTTYLLMKALFFCVRFGDFHALFVAEERDNKVFSEFFSLLKFTPLMSYLKCLEGYSRKLFFTNGSSFTETCTMATQGNFWYRFFQKQMSFEAEKLEQEFFTKPNDGSPDGKVYSFICVDRNPQIAFYIRNPFLLGLEDPCVITEIERRELL